MTPSGPGDRPAKPPARHTRPIGGGASAAGCADKAIDPERCEYRTVELAYWRNSRQPQSRRYVISRDGTGRLASRPDKNLLTGRPVGFLELYSLLSGSTHFVTR
jgi:hypothetical protein